MKMRVILRSFARASLILSLVAIGCRGVRRGEPFTGELDRKDQNVHRGQEVFQVHCYQCHPGGEGGLGPGLNDKPAPIWLMKTQVRLGLGVMPAFNEEQISGDQLNVLMTYLMALRTDQ